MPKTTLVHKIPLTLVVDPESVDIACDVPGVVVLDRPAQLVLRHKRSTDSDLHQYCYTIDTPPPTDDAVSYLAVYWGPNPESLTLWPAPHGGLWTSPTFKIGAQGASHCVLVVLHREPRVSTTARLNATRGGIAQPKTVAARRHVKSDFQGGDDEV